jgi:hypothetical protein
MWAQQERSFRPLSRSFIIKEGDISTINNMVRKKSRTELEDRIVNAIDVYGMIEESTPMNIRFLLCVIAFESLLLTGNDRAKSLSLARRISLLVGDSREWLGMHYGVPRGLETFQIDEEFAKTHRDEATQALKKKIVDMYKKRNSFTHQGIYEGNEIGRDDFIFLGTLLKLTVKKAIELSSQGFDKMPYL